METATAQGGISSILLIGSQDGHGLQELPTWIGHLGYRLHMATTPEQAIKLLNTDHVDLVLINAPAEKSATIVRQIKEACEELQWVPVICIDENEEIQTIFDIVDQGADDYLVSRATQTMLPAKLKATGRILALHQQLTNQAYQLQYAVEELKNMSTHDALTGVPNRRKFDEHLVMEWRRAQRAGTPLSLFMIDVDYFKEYNDCYGHVAGDDCLKRIAKTLTTSLRRPGDFMARYGGEEFAIILPETDQEGATTVADFILGCIREMEISHEKSDAAPHVSVSIGSSSIESDDQQATPEHLLKAADRALYLAKDAGRNTYRMEQITLH